MNSDKVPGDLTRTELSDRHKAEWRIFRNDNLEPALLACDYEQARTAKTLADAIRITQDGERKAWDFGEGMEAGDTETVISWE